MIQIQMLQKNKPNAVFKLDLFLQRLLDSQAHLLVLKKVKNEFYEQIEIKNTMVIQCLCQQFAKNYFVKFGHKTRILQNIVKQNTCQSWEKLGI